MAGSKLWRSRVCPKTLHPAWHQTHRFQGYLRDLGSEPLCVRVYDRDRLSMNDFMGKCQVSLENLEMNSTLEFKDIPLEGVSTGRVSFSARFELTPVFSLFPGTPLHASAAQARPPFTPTMPCLPHVHLAPCSLHCTLGTHTCRAYRG